MNTETMPSSDCPTIRVPGDLISTNIEHLRGEANRLLGDAAGLPSFNFLKIDLTAAGMVDSAGLNLIVTILKRLRARGAQLHIAYSNPNLLRTFIFTRLDQHVKLLKV